MNSDYYSQQVYKYWDKLERRADRRFLDDATAREAALFVLEKLADKDWARVRRFNGQAKFTTYLHVLVTNLLEDFAHHKFGKFRPPKWLSTLGGVWTKVFKLLCLERNPPERIVDIVSRSASAPPAEIAGIIDNILVEVPECGKTREPVFVHPDELDEYVITDPAGHALSPQHHTDALELADLVRKLSNVLFSDSGTQETDRLHSLMEKFASHLALTSEERLLLKMVYQDRLSVTEAGRMLGWNPDKTHGKLRRTLTRLRTALQESGLAEDLRAWLQEDSHRDL